MVQGQYLLRLLLPRARRRQLHPPQAVRGLLRRPQRVLVAQQLVVVRQLLQVHLLLVQVVVVVAREGEIPCSKCCNSTLSPM